MKRIRTLIGMLLVSMFVFGLAACGDSGAKDPAANNEILLQDFENYSDISKFVYSAPPTGKAEINSDPQYITNGNASLKLTLSDEDRHKDETKSMFFYVPLNENEDKNFSDVSKVYQISVDVFNASKEDVDVQLYLVQRGIHVITSKIQSKVVGSGEKATMIYHVNPQVAELMIDIKNLTHIGITSTGKNAVVYFDNLRIYTSDTEYTPLEIYVDEGEICSFEKPYQEFLGYTVGRSVIPKSEIIVAPDIASEGNRCAKIVTPPADTNAWISFRLPPKFLSAIKVSETDSNSYLCFDLKKTWDSSWWCGIRFAFGATAKSFTARNGQQWETYYIKFSDIGTFNAFEFSWQSKNGRPSGEGTFFIDNIRISETAPANGVRF